MVTQIKESLPPGPTGSYVQASGTSTRAAAEAAARLVVETKDCCCTGVVCVYYVYVS